MPALSKPQRRPPSSRSVPATTTLRLGVLCHRQLCAGCLTALFHTAIPGVETRSATTLEQLRGAFPNAQAPHVILYSSICPYSLDLDELTSLCAKAAPVPVIVHLDLPDPELVRPILKCGVRGVLPTSLPPSLAMAVIQLVMAGETYAPPLSPHAENGVGRGRTTRAGRIHRLTPRQTAVLRLATEGKSNKEIGRVLGVGENTIKFHISALMQKLGVSNRVRLAVVGSRMLDPPTAAWENSAPL